MKKQGKLIVIDGLDGSGKGTLTRMLFTYLQKNGVPVRRIAFPMYGEKSASLVEMYLKGELGSHPEDTGSYAASSFFAMDRYISYRTDWGKMLEDPRSVVIADRYTTANAVHQLTKLEREHWEDFLAWLFDFEYEKLGLPKPDATVYVEMPPAIAHRLIAKRSQTEGRSMDIHEKDPTHLERAYEAAMFAAKTLGWTCIPNYQGDDVRPIEETFAQLLSAVRLSGLENGKEKKEELL